MSDMTQPPTEEEQLAQAYYAKLDEFGHEANIRTSIGYASTSTKSTLSLIVKYLKFRGYKLPRKISLEDATLILMELDTKDEKIRCGLSLFLHDNKDKIGDSALIYHTK